MSILSYHNSSLVLEDIELFNDGQWLNDKIIGFILEYFEYDQFKDLSENVGFVSPEVTQFIKLVQGQNEVSIFLEPLCLKEKDLVFFPVNDNVYDAAGGTHWSILTLEKKSGIFLHYDSYGNSNETSAKLLAKKVANVLNGDCSIQFKKGIVPLQSNSYDCGMYAICFVEEICNFYKDKQKVPLELHLEPTDITKKRQQIKELISNLCNA